MKCELLYIASKDIKLNYYCEQKLNLKYYSNVFNESVQLFTVVVNKVILSAWFTCHRICTSRRVI